MLFSKKINARLIIIGCIFMIIFILANNFFVESILDKGVELTCNVHHQEISSTLDEEINLLKDVTQKISDDYKIISILDQNRNFEDLSREEAKIILNEINTFEGVVESASFVETINIVSLSGKYLFSEGVMHKNFDLKARVWFHDSINSTEEVFITDIHRDFATGLDTISILSYIYSDTRELLGAVVMDIFIKDFLQYSDQSFNIGDMDTYVIKNNNTFYSRSGRIKNNDKDVEKENLYFIKDDNSILGNENSLLYVFNKDRIKENSYIKTAIGITKFTLVIVALIISISLVLAIRLAFKPALKSIEKLKSILGYLDSDDSSFENKDEFKQLEIISDSLDKCFDKKVQSLIYYDDLTKLPNRKHLKIICNELIEANHEFALIFIDLNKFKMVNDVYGHWVGDQLLINFSNIMTEAIGDKGSVTRYSGDEFIIIYKDFKSNFELADYYEKNILSRFKEPIKINDEIKLLVDFSIGISVYPRNGLKVDELINKSDFMMYKNKKDNINKKIVFFNDDIYSDMLYVESIKNELKYACERDEFTLNYQPIYDEHKQVKKVEVLLRWNSPKLGFIPPDIFINYAEESREIISIGYWIIEQVCKYANRNNIDIEFSINVSPIQLMEVNFGKTVEEIIKKYNITYSKFCFEITEFVILEDNDIVNKNIEYIKNLGIKLALDDFGTGYASFNYLTKYPLDILKIDKVFLENDLESNFTIIEYIKKISNVLNIKVVIEGVETINQFDRLRKIKCDLFQGYYLSKPLKSDDFIELIESNKE